MHPAPSIIFFTVFSGLGFGMLAFLGLGMPGEATGFMAMIWFAIAFGLAVGGLISSTFHLGNPQRAIKAFSQWRTSWLSREGCLAVATLVVMGLYAFGIVFFKTPIALLGLIGAFLSVLTVLGTSMIYTQIKTVPRWHHWTTPLIFLSYALTGGAFLTGNVQIAAAGLITIGALQVLTWIIGDKRFTQSGSTIETATGLGSIGKTRMFEAPHSAKNYLMKEMVHVIGRKHARTLRIIGLVLLSLFPWALLMFFPFSHMLAIVALVAHIAGALTTRWLFFAEAEHTVGLYYGAR